MGMSTRNTSLVVEKLRHFRSLQRKMADRDRKLTPCARYHSVSVRLVLPLGGGGWKRADTELSAVPFSMPGYQEGRMIGLRNSLLDFWSLLQKLRLLLSCGGNLMTL